MNRFFLLLLLTYALTTLMRAQGSHPIPPGVRQAEQADAQREKDIPPPASPTRRLDPEKVRRDAAELAELAQSVPADVDRTTKGVLPKDLAEKLKKIEKLSKQLRRQLYP